MTIGKKIGLGFGTLLALVVTLAAVVLANLSEMSRQFASVIEHDTPIIANARYLSNLVVDMETGQRGFVITGKEEFLDPYENALVAFERLIEEEKALVSGNPPQVKLLEMIGAGVKEWEERAAQPEIAMRKKIRKAGSNTEQLQDILSKGVGKDIVDRIRAVAFEIASSFRADGNMHGVFLLERIQKCMVDQETGERGFLITGKEEFLEPYVSGQVELERAFVDMKTLVANDHDRDATTGALDKLDELHDQWIKEVAEPEIASRRQVNAKKNTQKEVENVLVKGLGKAILDEMCAITNSLNERFQTAQNTLLELALLDLEKAVVDQETGQRGFLISGRGEFLEPYLIGGEHWRSNMKEMRRLNSLTYDLPTLERNIARLEKLAADWLKNAAVPEIAARRAMDEHPASILDVTAMLELGTGKRILDRLRGQFSAFIEEEERLTAARFASASKACQSTRSTTILVATLAVLLGAIMATRITRGITIPAHRLTDALGRVAGGDFNQAIEISSKDEMGEASTSFNLMVGGLSRLNEERELGEQQLRAAKDYTDNIIRSMIDMLLVLAPEGAIVTVNEAACSLLGYRRDELIGQRASILFCEEEEGEEGEGDGEELQAIVTQSVFPVKRAVLHRLVQDGSISQVEKSLRTKSGKKIPVLLSGSLLRDNNGRFRGIVCVAQDVTDRTSDEKRRVRLQKEAEARAHELESQRLAMDEHSIVAITDPSGKITYANDKFCQISQFSLEELLGQDHRIVNSGHHPREFFADLWKTIASGNVWHGEVCNRAKDGSPYWVDTTIVPFKDESGRILQHVAIRTDITERKRGELELEATMNQLALAKQVADNANSAKSDFLANMSHEIRTPMTAILGFAENMLDVEQSEPERLSCIHTIRRNGEYLIGLINDILDLSKVEADKMTVEHTDCNPCQIIADVAALMHVRAEAKALPFEIDYIGAIPETIQSDPTRLRQILINMVGNAIKFTEIGAVRLVTRFVDSDNAPCLQFDVMDTGRGMTAEQVSNLFQPFMQADNSTTRKFGGTGLGLTISKRFAEMLGGDITVATSELGTGTTFRASIATGSLEGVKMVEDPLSATIVVDTPNTIASAARTDLEGVRILLAEDGPDNQRLIAFVLKKAGADVAIEENGKLAFDAALTARGEGRPFDVILMDMQMPVMDGYEATGQLRQKGYSGTIIALTAHAMDSDREKCIKAGCDDYATKPIDRKKLIETIQSKLVSAETRPVATA